MREPRREVAGRVDRVAGRAAERQADDEDEERDRQRAERGEAGLSAPAPKARITKTSTNVPMISLTMFQIVLRIAGPVL